MAMESNNNIENAEEGIGDHKRDSAISSTARTEKLSQGRLRALISPSAEGIYGIDLDGICTFANETCVRLLGYDSSDDLLGQHMHDLIHHTRPNGKPYPIEECPIHQTLQENRRYHADDEAFRRKDGSSFNVEYWSYPQVEDGAVVGSVMTFLDITEKKQLAGKVAALEIHLQRVIDNTLGFVGVLDTDGTLREVNETALKAGGLTRSEVIGKPYWESYWWSHEASVADELKDAIAHALHGEVVRYEVNVRVKGDARLAIDFMLAPVEDVNGDVSFLIASGVDISGRRAAERQVRQRVAQLDLALESGRMGIWEWDVASDHVDWSEQLYEILGYSEETCPPTKAGFLSIIHAEDRSQVEELLNAAEKQTCLSHNCEFRVVHGADGSTIWTQCRGTIERAPSGKLKSILSVAIDITARKQRELALTFLAQLQEDLADISMATEITEVATARVAQYMGLSHFMLVEMDEKADSATVVVDQCLDPATSLVGVCAMDDFASVQERKQLAHGIPMVVADTTASNRSSQLGQEFH